MKKAGGLGFMMTGKRVCVCVAVAGVGWGVGAALDFEILEIALERNPGPCDVAPVVNGPFSSRN